MPTADPELREKLLEAHLGLLSSQALSDWLRDIGQDPRGSIEAKCARIRQHTKYLETPVDEFPSRTLSFLRDYDARDLAQICVNLGLDDSGSTAVLVRRLYREIGFREGWLVRQLHPAPRTDLPTVLSFVEWYPILKNARYEKEYYGEFAEDMIEVFGDHNVHEQLAVAHGNALKIDFHIGHPQQGGIGVEFKLPTTNAECQRALGQVDQYIARYAGDLIVVLFPAFLQSAQRTLLLDELKRKGVTTIVKERVE